ncbi:MAG: DNA-primase RepB domain-containing protein [Candidatus Thiodiazotropha sp.]
MKAIDHTEKQIKWFVDVGVDLFDVAVRYHNGRMAWHRGVTESTLKLYLPWARSANAWKSYENPGADVYIRPARGEGWPILFFDDVPDWVIAEVPEADIPMLAVRTSREGGHHLWVHCDRKLCERDRYLWQRALHDTLQADPCSVSGEHLGRLAGVKNRKRGDEWVNVVYSYVTGEPLHLAATPPGASLRPNINQPDTPREGGAVVHLSGSRDSSDSGREWGYVCGALEHGADEDVVMADLEERARRRGKPNPAYYARTTVQKAKRHIQW